MRGRCGALARGALLGKVYARHQAADGEEIHGQPAEEARKGMQDKAGGVRGKPRLSQEQAKVPVSAVRCTVSFHPACPVLV